MSDQTAIDEIRAIVNIMDNSPLRACLCALLGAYEAGSMDALMALMMTFAHDELKRLKAMYN